MGHSPGRLSLRRSFFFLYVPGIILFFSFIFISWRLITLQYCSGFCHTLTWISHVFTYIPHPDPPSLILKLSHQLRSPTSCWDSSQDFREAPWPPGPGRKVWGCGARLRDGDSRRALGGFAQSNGKPASPLSSFLPSGSLTGKFVSLCEPQEFRMQRLIDQKWKLEAVYYSEKYID